MAGLARHCPRIGEYFWRLCRHPAHARHVQEEGAQLMSALLHTARAGLALTAFVAASPAFAAGGETAVNPIAALAYLAAGVLFILALRGLSSPESSRAGNRFGMIGMAIAV